MSVVQSSRTGLPCLALLLFVCVDIHRKAAATILKAELLTLRLIEADSLPILSLPILRSLSSNDALTDIAHCDVLGG
jgi:hypothetical protein